MITINYIIENHGWALIQIGNGNVIEDFHASYLHDSLKDLADSALEIFDKKHKTIFFVMEPGECQLVLNMINDNEIEFHLDLYKEWTQNNTQREPFIKLLKGKCSLINYKNEVRKNLLKIMNDLGPELYKEKWQLSDFPLEQFKLLK